MIGWGFTWIVSTAGVISGWLNPFFGLMVYYILAILRPPFLWFWAFNPVDPPRLSLYLAISVLFGWVIDSFGDWKPLAYKSVLIPLFGLTLYLLGGLIAWSYEPVYAPAAWEALSLQLKIGLMALVTITIVNDESRIKAFAWVTVASLGYLGETFNEWYHQNPIYLWQNGWGGIDNNGTAMVMVMGVPLAFFFMINHIRVSENAKLPISIGMVIVAASAAVGAGKTGMVIAAVALITIPVLFSNETAGLKLICGLAVGCMVHSILFSFLRGGQLGLIMVAAVLFTFALISLPKKGMTVALGVVFVVLGLALAGQEVRARFMTIFADEKERDASAESRFYTWSAGFRCMLDHPLGVGPRNFNMISELYGLAPNKSIHNLFLQTGADYGFLGMIGLAIFYFGTAISCFYASITRTARRMVWPRYFCQMVTISIAGFLVCSTFIGMESVEAAYVIALVGLCTVGHVYRVAAGEPVTASGNPPELDGIAEPDSYPIPGLVT